MDRNYLDRQNESLKQKQSSQAGVHAQGDKPAHAGEDL
jgi:hypothetical protein